MSLYKNKKVVVTGGSGFVGTHFIQELLDRGADVRTSIHKTPLKIQALRYSIDFRFTANPSDFFWVTFKVTSSIEANLIFQSTLLRIGKHD